MRRAGEKMLWCHISLPCTLIEKLDKEVRRMATETPWARVSRSDAVRAILSKALDERNPK